MNQMRPLLQRLWTRGVVASGVPAWRDRRILTAALADRPAGASEHLVLAAPGGGNIGDQAMLEALLERTGGPVRVVVGDEGAVGVPTWASERVELLTLPHLLYSSGPDHRRSLDAFAAAARQAGYLTVIGADVMDGRYSLRGSVNRAMLATVAAEAGIATRIIGFSWNSSARQAARIAVRAAGRAGVRLMFRDPVSAARAEAHGITGVERTADIAFAARSVDPSAAARFTDVGKPLALVNASGLISNDLDQVSEYARIVEHLRAIGRHVVILPHVSRTKADDVPTCVAIGDRVGPEDVTVVHELFTPAQIRGLTAVTDLVVTGRMHLAVMSLWNRRPAITLATQGKVEGLMELFGTHDLCVVPRPGFAQTVIQTLDRIVADPEARRDSIGRVLPRVIALAETNVSGLPQPEPSYDAVESGGV